MSNRPALRAATLPVVLAALVLAGATPRAGEIIEAVIVKVNGDILTKTELETREVAALRQRGQQSLSDEDLKKAIAEVTPQILVDTVDEMLILQRGRDLGYKLGDDQFKDVLDRIKKENKLETEEQFEAALKQENLTLAELRKSLEKQMIVNRVQQNEVMGKISVTEDGGADATTTRTRPSSRRPSSADDPRDARRGPGRPEGPATSAKTTRRRRRPRRCARGSRAARASRSWPRRPTTRRRSPTAA